MRRLLVSIIILTGTAIILPSCGSGGGDTVFFPHSPKAVVSIMTSGSLADGTEIGGIDVTLNLPDGVSVKAAPDAENPAVLVTGSGVVKVSGVAAGTDAGATGTYTASPNAVAIYVFNPHGFGTGEFVTVTCDLASHATVTAGDFGTGALDVVDTEGAGINGLTAGLTAEIE